MAMSFTERYKAQKAGAGASAVSASNTGKKSFTERYNEQKLRGEIGLSTIEDDLKTTGETVSRIYGNWQTADTMEKERENVSKMYDRLNSYKAYVNQYSAVEDLPKFNEEMDKLIGGYDSALKDWDNRKNIYANYLNADAYNAARKKSELAEKYKGLNYAGVQKAMAETQDKEEQDFLSKYGTNVGYGSLADYDAELADVKDKISGEKYSKWLQNSYKEYYDKLEDARNQFDMEHRLDSYKGIMQNVDYAEKSQYVPKEADNLLEKVFGVMGQDGRYNSINERNGLTFEQKEMLERTRPFQYKGDYDLYSMTPEELGIYNYIYNTEGAKSANAYLEDVKISIQKRNYEHEKEVQEMMWDTIGPVQKGIMSAMTVPIDVVVGPLAFLESAGRKVTGKEINPYSGYNREMLRTEEIRENARDDIAAITDGFNILGQNAGAFLFDTGLSIGESALGVGLAGKASALLMGMGAAASTARELKEKGANEKDITAASLLAGGAEVIFEEVSLENLLKYKGTDSMKGLIINTLKQAGVEASEEIFTEIANKTSDYLVRGGASDYAYMLETLMEKGYSEEEAKKRASMEAAKEVALAGLGGAISGGIMGGVGVASEYGENRRIGKTIQANHRTDLLAEAAGEVNTEEYRRYNYAGKLADNKATTAQLGNLYKKTAEQADTKTMAKLLGVFIPKSEETVKVENRVKEMNTAAENTEISSGEKIAIQGMKTDKDGNTVLVTDKGEKSLKDVTLTDKDAEVIAMAEGMADDAKADLFVSLYESGKDTENYKTSFELAYSYGVNGFGADETLRNKGVLTERQAAQVYEFGVKNATNEQQKRIDAVTEKHFAEGRGITAGVFDDSAVKYDKLSEKQWNAVRFAKMLSEKTGVNITFFQSEVDENGRRTAENGRYDASTNTIYVDTYAGILTAAEDNSDFTDSIIPTLSHEMTHWMKDKAPELYHRLSGIVMETLAKDTDASPEELIGAEISRQKEQYKRDVSAEYAQDEFIARACEDMLANSDKVKEYVSKMDAAEAKTLKDKLAGVIKKLKKWISDVLREYKSKSAEAAILRKYADKLDALQKAWDEAFESAIKANAAQTEKDGSGAAEKETVKKSEREEKKDYHIDENGVVVLDTPVFSVEDVKKEAAVVRSLMRDALSELKGQSVVIESDGSEVFFDKRFAQEYAYSKSSRDNDAIRQYAKSNASLAIKEIVQKAEYVSREENKKEKKAKIAGRGLKRYKVWFGINENVEGTKSEAHYFSGTFIVRMDSNGKDYAYDIVTIRKEQPHRMTRISKDTRKTESLAVPSKDSIPQSDENASEKIKNSDRIGTWELSEDDYASLKSHFGTTNNFKVAGYMLKDGSLLDFSGRHWGDTGSTMRQVDHRDVWEVWENPDRDGLEEMVNLISNGNIRINAETHGLNIAVMPTDEQVAMLKKYMDSVDGEVIIDFDEIGGDTVESYRYDKGTSADRIISDIRNYFRGGRRSELAQFRYSDRDSEGNSLTKEQIAFFKDSKARDENGNLKVVYHGTNTAGFTEFRRNHIWFTDNTAIGESYTGNGGIYKGYLNIRNPLIIDVGGSVWSSIPVSAIKDKKVVDYFQIAGASVFEENGVLCTSTDDIISAVEDGISEGEFDYDGVILRDINDEGSYGKIGNNVGNDYVIFHSNQFKNIDNAAPTENQDIRYSDREGKNIFGLDSYSQKEIDNWKNSNILFAETEKDIAEYVRNNVKSGENTRLYCGKIGKILAERIYKDTGISLEGYNIAITSSFENSHANEAKETLRGQVVMTPEEVAKFPYIVANYDRVELRGNSKEGNQAIAFIKEINGKRETVTYVLKKRRMLALQTMYGWKQKKNSHTATDASYNANATTSETTSDMSSSKDSISQSGENTSGKINFSDRETESIYSAVGELGKLQAENEKLKRDVVRLREKNRIEQAAAKERTLSKSHIDTIAKHLLENSQSGYSKEKLSEELTALYSYLQDADVEWDVFMVKATDTARRIIAETDGQKNYEKQVANILEKMGVSVNSEIAREASDVMEAYENTENARTVAMEIYNQFWNVSPVKTLTDGQDVAIKKLRAEHRNEMRELKQKYSEKVIRELRREYRADLKEMEARYKATVETLRTQQRYDIAKFRKDYKEKRERKEKVDQITKKAMKLNTWLVKNSAKQHVPEIFKKPVAAVLRSLDFSSMRLLGMQGGDMKGQPTQKDISISRAMEHLADVVTKISDAQLGEKEFAELGGYIDLPPAFATIVREESQKMNDLLRSFGDNEHILNQMSLEQLENLDQIITTLTHAVTQMNEALAANHYTEINNLAQNTMVEVKKLGKHSKKVGKVTDFFNFDNALPVYAFRRFGEGGKKIFELFQDGWDKFAFNVKKVMDYALETYTDKEVKEWSKQVHEFDLRVKDRVEKVRMTTAQVMSLYCLVKREQAKGHLMAEGMRVADFKVKGEKVSQTENAKLYEGDIAKILSVLDARQIEVADKLQEFMNTVCTDWGNEVSMKRFGFKAFGELNYFPIKTNANSRDMEIAGEENSIFRLTNMSFTKGTIEKASNGIMIENIFDVFAEHCSDMAKYNAFALPVLDMFKWYNYKEKVMENGEDADDRHYDTYSVKEALEYAYGAGAKNYIRQFLLDINGDSTGGITNGEKLSRKMMANYKVAAVGANIRVAILQPTSYVRASAVIDPKYLAKGLANMPRIKESVEEAKEVCGIALWKSMGFYDTNITRGVKDQIKHADTVVDKIREISMTPAEIGDSVTWGVIYAACKAEVSDMQPGLSEEAKKTAAAKRFREVIYLTQVVDSTMTRTQMMRNKSSLNQMLTSFMSEPMVSYNLLYDCYSQFNEDYRRAGGGKAGAEYALKKNGKKIARSTFAYVLTNLVSALAAAGPDTLRSNDDDKEVAEIFLESVRDNMISDVTGMLPNFKDVASIVEGYSTTRMDEQAFVSSVKAGKNIVKAIENGKMNYKTVYSAVQAASQLTGIPVSNAMRDVVAIWNSTMGEVFDSLEIK